MSSEPVKAERLREARVYLGLSRDDVSGPMPERKDVMAELAKEAGDG